MRVQKSTTSGLASFLILAIFFCGGILRETAAIDPWYKCSNVPTMETPNYIYDQSYVAPNADLTRNMTEFLATFRERGFDDWNTPYTDVKGHMYAFKAKHIAENLNPGDSIYESACGIGLNLLMTLEIVAEMKGPESIENIQVYGNDFLANSVSIARTFLDLALPKGVRLGTICDGDSTNLGFVPSNAFDLVYTGYLTERNFKDHAAKAIHLAACENQSSDAVKFRNQMQRANEEWHARWVGEMIRIAKPGKVVIIEHITPPICDNSSWGNWGGVAREWWYRAMEEYSWDIDPQSLVFMNDTLWPAYGRYHVMMRRKAEKDDL